MSFSTGLIRQGGMNTLQKATHIQIVNITLLALPLICAQRGAAEDPAASLTRTAALMQGKVKTERTIVLDVTVNATPSEVFRLWTSTDGIRKFFAPDARIDSEPGGRYQIIFAPGKDPEGDSHGTKGARILKFIPDKELSFEWITFAGDNLLGKNAPPYAPSSRRNVKPLPTWVELSFESVDGQSNRTHVKFAHYGFGTGDLWEQSYQWFTRAWKGVLDQLAAYCANRKEQT
jgi:uncharacterized protein YndB with AHSA1/START domain